MQQKLRDLWLRIRTERKWTFVALGLGAAMLFLVFSAGNPPRMAKKKPGGKGGPVQTDPALLANSEAFDDLQKRFFNDLQANREDIKQLRAESDENRKAMKEYEERTAQIFSQIIKKLADKEQPGGAGGPANYVSAPRVQEVPGSDSMSSTIDNVSLSDDNLEKLWDEQKLVVPPAPPPPQKVAFIGAGDSVKVQLLSGVNAPTDGTPYPVVFKVVGDIAGPDGSALPIGEARLIAAAQGSLTDSRALFRLTSINIRLPDGRRKVLKADGWIVGEDGIRGMSGVLNDPLGKAIGGAGFAGFLEGVGEGISSANTRTRQNFTTGTSSTEVTGSIGAFAAGRGASNAAREWSDIIRERLSTMVPVVEVLSGRSATAVFAKNITISGLYEALEDGEEAGMPSVD